MGSKLEYRVPFDVGIYPVRISQGNNGPWSHFLQRHEIKIAPGGHVEKDLRYAVDFALPFGTEVTAARDGEVRDLWLGSGVSYEGLDPLVGNSLPFGSTNFLTVVHEDGTVAWYSHLGGEAMVSRGRKVRAGEQIAITGKSGWVAEVPHLHFQVNVAVANLIRSVPVAFAEYNGPLEHADLLERRLVWFGGRKR